MDNTERIYSSEYSTVYRDCPEYDIIETIIEYAYDNEYGQLEILRAKQDKLIEIVSEIFLRLSPEDRNDVVKETSTYSLKEKNDAN